MEFSCETRSLNKGSHGQFMSHSSRVSFYYGFQRKTVCPYTNQVQKADYFEVANVFQCIFDISNRVCDYDCFLFQILCSRFDTKAKYRKWPLVTYNTVHCKLLRLRISNKCVTNSRHFVKNLMKTNKSLHWRCFLKFNKLTYSRK